MNADGYIKGQLAAIAIREGRMLGTSSALMLAIAQVIRNRIDAGWHGGDWLKVLVDLEMTSAHKPTAMMPPDLRDPAVKYALARVDDIYSGTFDDEMTGGGLYYCRLDDTKMRPWFKRNILKRLDEHPRVAAVEAVSFFR